MQNLLKFIQTATAPDLYMLNSIIGKRIDQLERDLKEHEQKEREQQWDLWKERTLVLVGDMGKRLAVEEAYKTLSNLWIQRDEEITCPECGNDCDEYYEFIFCKGIDACSECTECVDLRGIFNLMEDEIQENKKIRTKE